MNNFLVKYLPTVQSITQQVGEKLKEDFYKERRIQKANSRDVHLSNDLLSENYIQKNLKRYFPKIGFWGEESGKNKVKKRYWVVDPLDGTVNYYFYNPFFAISIALVENKEIVFGLVYAPMADEFFWAAKGEGAFYQGNKIEIIKDNSFNKAVYGGYNTRQRCVHISQFGLPGNKILNKMEMGCASLELVYVGMSRINTYLLENIRLWDVAAGIIFINEAGGQVTNWQGRDWTIGDKYLLASNNQKIHKKVLKKISLSESNIFR